MLKKNLLRHPVTRGPVQGPGKRKYGSAGRSIKIRKLSWKHFLLISLIIFILPVVREWQTLLYGERVTGEVIAYRQFNPDGEIVHDGQIVRSEIEFIKSGKRYYLYGPENLKYKLGKQVSIRLSKKKPGDFIIASFSGFYLQKRSVSLLIVFTIWLAIYSTIVQVQKGTLTDRGKRIS